MRITPATTNVAETVLPTPAPVTPGASTAATMVAPSAPLTGPDSTGTTARRFGDSPQTATLPLYPATRRDSIVEELHGQKVADPYRVPVDGTAPAILYGYGGFNSAMTPDFRASIIPWLEAGGVYAIANLRGGNEFGEVWHRDGMLHKKQNVFDDMIAGAEFLVGSGYAAKDRLAAAGGSNGGLLVGAMLTQRPDLWRAIVCGAPLLDMVRYTEYGSGKTWISEYGDPENSKADFDVLYAYSPYHRVQDGTTYPAVIIQSPYNDDRVDPMHARKTLAALQHASTSGNPVIMRVARDAGHTGGASLKATVDQLTDTYAFLFAEMGVDLE